MSTGQRGVPPPHRVGPTVVAVVGVLVAVVGCSPTATAPASDESASASSPARCRVVPASGTDGPPPAARDRLRASCTRALPTVEQVWPAWTGTAVILVSADAFEPGTAARVEGLAREGEPSRGDRIVVAPGLTDSLSPEGLDIVLRHELAHLAMRGTGTAALPLWASEGIAMHVGYAPVVGPRRERRAELMRLRDRVEQGGWPATVPAPSRFEDSADRADAYSAAWLGVEVLIDRLGRDRVLQAVSEAASEAAPRTAGEARTDEDRTRLLLRSLGMSERRFAELWRAELVRRTA